ncbi:hypothetical protein VB638_18830 [Dolichospermum sp. UHCC 0684]|uniref:hypothetical protein n=1 Tax=unclassified Dolichospermum TaxID=2622029 RepID=UPI00144782A9|nr:MULTISPECIES: hypothetical protein [unclassified Dolichospermum]MEA5531597.1 hypothetical protein [Dolichospermum sp. UHCC 0684]MTJ34755.1 hypothetical protein [Dolichospermum sp. UHCC 0260]
MKQKNNFAQILKDKKDKLNWQNFNFLENMLVFSTMRTMPGRNAPPESGIHFRITLDSQNKAICILFKIDRDHQKNDPLITDKKLRRPDYMSLYIDSESCICTIIEMKGKTIDELKRGIDQILQLKEILQFEIFNHLSTKLKVKYQGILLTTPNADIPLKKITQVNSPDFKIVSLKCDQKAELYPYVSKSNDFKDRYKHQKITESTPLFIEQILTTRSLPKRIPDEYYSKNFSNSQDREGIYINYLLPNDTDYITLLSNTTLTEINMEENEYMKEIIEELKLLNLIDRLAIKFSNNQISNYDN